VAEGTLTISRLARKHGLSRSTLLYYASIGLLKPSGRSRASYRSYSRADDDRLAQVCEYRQAGLSLAEIQRILDGPATKVTMVLERRLEELNHEVARLRDQQRFILRILKSGTLQRRIGVMNKEQWKAILRASGASDQDMRRWHAEFERLDPQKHQEFLEFLCIPDDEIAALRASLLRECSPNEESAAATTEVRRS